jgi:hypothetical protein
MNALLVSCGLCQGTKIAFDGECQSCKAPDPALARRVLGMLRSQQIELLRAFEHTLAYQPLTEAEFKAIRCEFWVEEDDVLRDLDTDAVIAPGTRHWFAGSWSRSQSGETTFSHFIRYNPLGLLLRTCLMPGADAGVQP